MAKKKYFKTRTEAMQALLERDPYMVLLEIHKMPKGSRHHGMYAVCDYIECLNTY